MRVEINDIFIGDRQRKDYGTAELDDLKKDLEENGQIQPIAVRPPNDDDKTEEDYEDQPWVLIAGGRRLRAAMLLGWPDIEAFGREEMSTLVASILELHENLKRKAMSWQEQVEAKSQISALRRLENPKITDAEIAKELGETPANFSRDLKTAKYLKENPGLKKSSSKHSALNAGKILEEHKERTEKAARIAAQPTKSSIPEVEKRIVTSDALSFVQSLEEQSIDLTLIDGPYGYNYWKQGQKSTKAEGDHLSSYDDSPETVGPMYRELFPELVRATRETGWLVMFCGKETYDFLEELTLDCCATHAAYRDNQLSSQCEAASRDKEKCRFLKPEPYPWIWYRPNSRNQPRFPNLHAKNMAELILVVNLGRGRIVKTPAPSVLVHDADYGTERVHANQKPIPLYRELIERFTFAGDAVLDCFFGSGNSLAAASSLARIPWGSDKNAEMLPFAIGNVKQSEQTISPATIKASQERFRKNLANPYAEVSGEEIEEAPEVRREIQAGRNPNMTWDYEIFRIGGEYLGYIRYDGHNLDQRRGADRDELEQVLIEACSALDFLSEEGQLDPCCCTPEEAQAALKEYLEMLEAEEGLEVEEV